MLDIPQLQRHLLALDHGDETARRQALQSLRQHDEQAWAAVPVEECDSLVEALKGQLLSGRKQPSAQKEVATVLGNLGPRCRSALPQLLDLLREGTGEQVREAAAIALGKMGKEAKAAVDDLILLSAHSRPALSAQAIRALGNIGCADGRVRSALLSRWPPSLPLKADNAQVAIALCKLHIVAEGLLATVTRTLMAKQEPGLRKAAAEALAWCGKKEPDVVPALLSASLGDINEEVRQLAQAGLDRMRLSHAEAVRLCAGQLGESPYAETALRRSGQLAVPVLREALGRKEPAIRVRAVRTLGGLGELAAEAVPALTAAAHDADPEVRLAAAKGLWHITKTADVVVPALVNLLAGEGAAGLEPGETRRQFLQTVMEALGRVGPPAAAAVPALTALTKDDNRHLRESALITLGKIAPAVADASGLPR
jgi:HEAT repeat protein